jgi:hypothetical protein
MSDEQRSETFVNRVERELNAFAALWGRHKVVAGIVVIAAGVLAYPHVEKLFRSNPVRTADAEDPGKVFIVKTLIEDPVTKSASYLYFLKVEGDIWFEVNSDPHQYVRFMFQMRSIDANEIELFDATRDVELTLDFENRAIWYVGPDDNEKRKLYSIVRSTVIGD